MTKLNLKVGKMSKNLKIFVNNLEIGKSISIYFGGELPSVVNGLITNIENDMIEITALPTALKETVGTIISSCSLKSKKFVDIKID